MAQSDSGGFMRYVLLGWIVCLAVTCPFTKVEESFNMQAVHDLLRHGTEIARYDHLEFPGVVPRSFLGAMAVAAVAWPLQLLSSAYCHALQALGSEAQAPSPALLQQLSARLATATLLWLSFCTFESGVARRLGPMVAELTTLLTCLQFHLPFYMSRTLPNTLALALCLVAFGAWLRGAHTRALLIIAVGAVTLRCDLVVLLAPLALHCLARGHVPFWRTLLLGLGVSALALAVTVGVDSFFWRPSGTGLLQGPRSWLWPEGAVLFFNTLENKSSLWGTQPWHWYFSSALPRAMHVTLPLVLVGLLGLRRPREGLRTLTPPPSAPPSTSTASSASPPTADAAADKEMELAGLLLGEALDCLPGPDWALFSLLSPALAFVGLYSLLPHKELRFVFAAVPLLNMAAAVGLSRLLPPPFQEGWERTGHDVTPDPTPTPSLHHSLRARRASHAIKYTLAFFANSALLLLLPLGLAADGLFWASSARNYPGGEALQRLLRVHLPEHLADSAIAAAALSGLPGAETCAEKDGPASVYARGLASLASGPAATRVSVHVGPEAAMAGVTRFLQAGPSAARVAEAIELRAAAACPSTFSSSPSLSLQALALPEVVYSKREGLSPTEMEAHDWLLASPGEAAALREGAFVVRDTVYAFSRLVKGHEDGGQNVYVPLWRTALSVELAPAVLILQRHL